MMMSLKCIEHPLLSKQTTMPMVKLVTNPYCEVKYELHKLMMLSPLLKNIIAELNIPPALSYLLDVTVMMPGMEVEAMVLLMKMLGGEAVNATLGQRTQILELVESLGITNFVLHGKNMSEPETRENTEDEVTVEMEEDLDISSVSTLDNNDEVDDSDSHTNGTNKKKVSEVIDKEQETFECEECGTRMKTKKLLKRHLNKHTGQLHTPCDLCGKVFNRKDSMNSHKKRMHVKVEKCNKI